MDMSRALRFPLPISSTVEQLYILGSAHGYGLDDDAGIVRLFLPMSRDDVHKSALRRSSPQVLGTNGLQEPTKRVGMIGLGAMGQGMAQSLLRAGYTVAGFDVHQPSVDKFLRNSGDAKGARSAAEAVRGADVVIFMVQNASQVDDALFGAGDSLMHLQDGCTIVLSSTVPPKYARELGEKLDSFGKGHGLVDAPVSGGVARAAAGTLTVRGSTLHDPCFYDILVH